MLGAEDWGLCVKAESGLLAPLLWGCRLQLSTSLPKTSTMPDPFPTLGRGLHG